MQHIPIHRFQKGSLAKYLTIQQIKIPVLAEKSDDSSYIGMLFSQSKFLHDYIAWYIA